MKEVKFNFESRASVLGRLLEKSFTSEREDKTRCSYDTERISTVLIILLSFTALITVAFELLQRKKKNSKKRLTRGKKCVIGFCASVASSIALSFLYILVNIEVVRNVVRIIDVYIYLTSKWIVLGAIFGSVLRKITPEVFGAMFILCYMLHLPLAFIYDSQEGADFLISIFDFSATWILFLIGLIFKIYRYSTTCHKKHRKCLEPFMRNICCYFITMTIDTMITLGVPYFTAIKSDSSNPEYMFILELVYVWEGIMIGLFYLVIDTTSRKRRKYESSDESSLECPSLEDDSATKKRKEELKMIEKKISEESYGARQRGQTSQGRY